MSLCEIFLESIIFERRNSIAIIRFNRPEKWNAQDEQLTGDPNRTVSQTVVDE